MSDAQRLSGWRASQHGNAPSRLSSPDGAFSAAARWAHDAAHRGRVWLTYTTVCGVHIDGTRHVWERGRGYRTEDADTVPTDLAELIPEDLRHLW